MMTQREKGSAKEGAFASFFFGFILVSSLFAHVNELVCYPCGSLWPPKRYALSVWVRSAGT